MIQGIHHFAIIASSEASIEFYQRFGFVEHFRQNREYDTVVLLRGPQGIELEMFIDPNHPKRTSPESLGLRHIAFKVDSIEDTVSEFGLETGPIMTDWTGVRFAYCSDPDGNTVELHE